MSVAEAEIACAGKVAYQTYAEAEVALKRGLMRRRRSGRRRGTRCNHLEIYRCKNCRRWHVGSTRLKNRPGRPQVAGVRAG